MSNFDIGAAVVGSLALIAYVTSLEWRLRNVQSKLIQSNQKNVDTKIEKDVHALPDNELDAALKKDMG